MPDEIVGRINQQRLRAPQLTRWLQCGIIWDGIAYGLNWHWISYQFTKRAIVITCGLNWPSSPCQWSTSLVSDELVNMITQYVMFSLSSNSYKHLHSFSMHIIVPGKISMTKYFYDYIFTLIRSFLSHNLIISDTAFEINFIISNSFGNVQTNQVIIVTYNALTPVHARSCCKTCLATVLIRSIFAREKLHERFSASAVFPAQNRTN